MRTKNKLRLTFWGKANIINRDAEKNNAPLAQLDRAFGYGPKGRGFESPKARHEKAPLNHNKMCVQKGFFVFP